MVSIKNTYICPRCEEGITGSNKPDFCPSCGFKLSLNSNQFTAPLTIAEQQERINNKVEHARFILELPIDTAASILNDALHIVQTIPGKKVRASDIRSLMGMAIQIGEVAKQYEEFLAAGGTHTPGLFITTGENEHEQQKTRDGEKAASPVPSPLFSPMGKDE
jgi:hypothetical protein